MLVAIAIGLLALMVLLAMAFPRLKRARMKLGPVDVGIETHNQDQTVAAEPQDRVVEPLRLEFFEIDSERCRFIKTTAQNSNIMRIAQMRQSLGDSAFEFPFFEPRIDRHNPVFQLVLSNDSGRSVLVTTFKLELIARAGLCGSGPPREVVRSDHRYELEIPVTPSIACVAAQPPYRIEAGEQGSVGIAIKAPLSVDEFLLRIAVEGSRGESVSTPPFFVRI